MSKLIHLVVESCGECPYTQEDIFVGEYVGWVCTQRARVAGRPNNYRDCEDLTDNEHLDPGIPDWCPLPEAKLPKQYSICLHCALDSMTGIQDCGYHPTGVADILITECEGYQVRRTWGGDHE